METLGIVSIIGLVAIIIVKEFVSHKERLQIEKLRKAKDVNDVLTLDKKPEGENEVLEEDNLVDLADMPDMPFQEKVEG